MKNGLKIGLIVIAFFVAIVGFSFGMGWTDVLYTKTVGKAKQNAQREVFEQTQSYVEGKRQMALKYYKEYQAADESGKRAIKELVALDFANVDEEEILTGRVRQFVIDCKY